MRKLILITGLILIGLSLPAQPWGGGGNGYHGNGNGNGNGGGPGGGHHGHGHGHHKPGAPIDAAIPALLILAAGFGVYKITKKHTE